MEDLAIWPCLVTLSLASVLQGAEGNTTLATGTEGRKANDDTFGHLELCCQENKLCASNMACIACLCRCPLYYTYNSGTGQCDAPVVPTTSATNTSSNTRKDGNGKLPGESCVNESTCVEGLVCVERKCQCPEPCVYLKEQMACDCGGPDLVWPCVVGVMVGIIIVAFWGMCISSSVKSHMEERNKVMQLSQHQAPRISTLGAAYGSEHLTVPPPVPALGPSAPPTATPSPAPTPAPLRLSRQAVAPTPPPQPVFRP